MNTAIITVAGVSSRFNEGIDLSAHVLKCLYTETDEKETLLYHLLTKCSFADEIILVGGYQFRELKEFYSSKLASEFPNVILVQNDHFQDLSSGYSLFLGIQAAKNHKPDAIFFVEGDLDLDSASFQKVVSSKKTVLTISNEPIYADKAVVLYQDRNGSFHYAFNSSHGLLSIDEPFSAIFNSAQIWRFSSPKTLYQANDAFGANDREGTNLSIIQRYIDRFPEQEIELVRISHWVNCNTRTDYLHIVEYWRTDK